MYNFVVEYRKITSINKYSLEKKVFEVATKVKHVTKGGLLIRVLLRLVAHPILNVTLATDQK